MHRERNRGMTLAHPFDESVRITVELAVPVDRIFVKAAS
jgi:hypothetical protein